MRDRFLHRPNCRGRIPLYLGQVHSAPAKAARSSQIRRRGTHPTGRFAMRFMHIARPGLAATRFSYFLSDWSLCACDSPERAARALLSSISMACSGVDIDSLRGDDRELGYLATVAISFGPD